MTFLASMELEPLMRRALVLVVVDAVKKALGAENVSKCSSHDVYYMTI